MRASLALVLFCTHSVSTRSCSTCSTVSSLSSTSPGNSTPLTHNMANRWSAAACLIYKQNKTILVTIPPISIFGLIWWSCAHSKTLNKIFFLWLTFGIGWPVWLSSDLAAILAVVRDPTRPRLLYSFRQSSNRWGARSRNATCWTARYIPVHASSDAFTNTPCSISRSVNMRAGFISLLVRLSVCSNLVNSSTIPSAVHPISNCPGCGNWSALPATVFTVEAVSASGNVSAYVATAFTAYFP